MIPIHPFLIVSIVFAALYFLIIAYYFTGWFRLPAAKKSEEDIPAAAWPFVSIIVPVRNESAHIGACLQSLQAQQYPAGKMEVIVIDDYSTDATLRLSRGFEKESFTVLDLQQYLGQPGEYVPNKKKAIALGIKNAKGELILTTDGDCTRGENWLQTMVAYYRQHDFRLLSGPVMVKPARNPFAWFQQLDVITLLGVTGGAIGHRAPVMCNGANLLYAKQTFLEVEGFKGNHDVPTGDDIFLMQKIQQRYPGGVGFVKSYEAAVFTRAETSLSGFMAQRVRWVSKSKSYGSFSTRFVLLMVYLFHFVLLAAAAYLLVPEPWNWLPLAVCGSAKLLADGVFSIPVTHFFRKKVLLLLLPFMEFFHVWYILLLGISALWGRYRWKDRTVN